ncbi:predicted protein [Postia placenta Mad-698-R]|nr:predicted protein [Postia placenta Mad-698-R]
MSALSDAEYLRQIYLQNVASVACLSRRTDRPPWNAAVYTYELVITIEQQVRFLARRRFSAIAVLYTSMHLSTMIFLLAWLVGWVFRDCHSVFIVNAVLRLVFGVISGFRVYAINGQKLLLPLFIAVLYVPDIVEWTASRQTYTKDPVIGCVINYSLSKGVENICKADCITTILISRMFLNLSNIHYPPMGLTTTTATQHLADTMHFGSSEWHTNVFSADAASSSDVVHDGEIDMTGYILEPRGTTSGGTSYEILDQLEHEYLHISLEKQQGTRYAARNDIGTIYNTFRDQTLALARRLTSVRPLRPTEVSAYLSRVMSPTDAYEITLGSNESPVSRLPKLAEDGSNWVLFKAQFKATVSSKGLLRFLEGRDKIPIEPTAPGVDSDADEKEA